MKKKLINGLFTALYLLGLTACGGSPSKNPSGGGTFVPTIDNSVDLKEYEEDEYKTSDEKYYLSDYISFIMSVKGYYQINIPFTLDSNNENLRVFDNMYFYEGDYFQLMSKDYKYIWATLKNEKNDYLSTLREEGQDIQVDVKISGVYKIVLDITTMVMDFTYKSAIETPYYYPFENCAIGVLVESSIVYSDLNINSENTNEFVIKNYEVKSGKLYSFFDKYSHVSVYKLTVEEGSQQYVSNTMFDTSVVFNLDGEFNIYVNKVTYSIRVEVSDPSKLVYHCLTYRDGGFVTLSPKDPSTPYIFEYEYEATSDVGGYGLVSDDLPKFYSKSYEEYKFTVEESSLLGNYNGSYYFKKAGHYLITINLLELTLKVEAAQ